MKLLLGLCLALVLVLMTGRCSAQKPHRCQPPPQLSGSMSVSAADGQIRAVVKYLYDAIGQRIYLKGFVQVQSISFHESALFLFKEGVVYFINYRNRTCEKNPLRTSFHPSHIPHNASHVSQVILGGSSAPGEGLLVNTWTGDVPETGGKYLSSVTAFGCIPVTTLYYTEETGWIVSTYYNAVRGIPDPGKFIPPSFCPDAVTDHEQLDFFSAFF